MKKNMYPVKININNNPEDITILPSYHNIKCTHYQRKCKILAPCCNKLFDCRLCHDVIKDENEKNYDKSHKLNPLDSKNIKYVMCKECLTLQNINKNCVNCNICMGEYFCEKCRFYDNNKNQLYFHCDDCGICRRGEKEKFFHCKLCDMCFNLGHICNNKKKNIKDAQCPICFEDINTSIEQSFQLICGHMMHICCYEKYNLTSDKCPICSKNTHKNEEKDNLLKILKTILPQQKELSEMEINILCNECEKKNKIKFHYIGLECPDCNSFNTKQI
jgi:RING finger and CHY zinc finger domain-containing protein 1